MPEPIVVKVAGSSSSDSGLGLRELKCPHCGKRIYSQSYIEFGYHIGAEKTHFCPSCGFQYYTKSKFADGSKSGYWVRSKNDTHCSECGDIIAEKKVNKYDRSIITNDFHNIPGLSSLKYCRVCGALMFDNIEQVNIYRAEHNRKLKVHTGSSSLLQTKRAFTDLLKSIAKTAAIIISVLIVLAVIGSLMS